MAAASDAQGDAPVGVYVYHTTFDLGLLDPSQVLLSGSWMAAGLDIRLNNVSLHKTATSNSLSGFVANSGFVSRVNTLDFVVQSIDPTGGGAATPTGLIVPSLILQSGTSAVVGPPTTGVDDSEVSLPDGTPDGHYTILAADPLAIYGPAPAGYAGATTTLTPGAPPPAWLADNGSSRGIAAAASDAQGDAPAGVYVYRTTFDVTNLDPTQLTLTSTWTTGGEGIDVRLNNVSLGTTTTNNTAANFAVNTGFLSGTNTLDFVVQSDAAAGSNDVSPTGLLVSALALQQVTTRTATTAGR